MAAPGMADHASVTLGFRPEDCAVVPEGQGRIDAKVYTFEMTGDQALVTFRTDDNQIVAKMPKDFEIADGDMAAVTFEDEVATYFDTASGLRLRPQT